ncbi:MAG: hypothetical protein ACR2H3_16570 [Acidimicrobiales bacterium]
MASEALALIEEAGRLLRQTVRSIDAGTAEILPGTGEVAGSVA